MTTRPNSAESLAKSLYPIDPQGWTLIPCENDFALREQKAFIAGHQASEAEWKIERRQLKDWLDADRMRLTACGVAAGQNTETTVKARLGRDSLYYSASYSDVCGAIDREMNLIAQLAKAMKALKQADKRMAEMGCPENGWEREPLQEIISSAHANGVCG